MKMLFLGTQWWTFTEVDRAGFGQGRCQTVLMKVREFFFLIHLSHMITVMLSTIMNSLSLYYTAMQSISHLSRL